MKAKILIEIDLKYDKTTYKPLIEIAKNEYYSKRDKIFKWVFGLEDLPKVCKIIGKPISFEKDQTKEIALRTPGLKEKLIKKSVYGKGFIKIRLNDSENPTGYIVTTVREKKEEHTEVSFETVNALWNVIKDQPLYKKVLTHTVAEKYCNELGITRFNRTSKGNFLWPFFRGERKYYLVFYSAIKVLQGLGVVDHIIAASKSGIARIKDNFEIQTKLQGDIEL